MQFYGKQNSYLFLYLDNVSRNNIKTFKIVIILWIPTKKHWMETHRGDENATRSDWLKSKKPTQRE